MKPGPDPVQFKTGTNFDYLTILSQIFSVKNCLSQKPLCMCLDMKF